MSALAGKVAIITGSSMGIGKATALLLAEKGCKVVLNGRNEVKLQKALSTFQKAGHDAFAIAADVSKWDSCEMLIKKCLEHYGRLDILINNAGVSMRGSFDTLDKEVFEKVYGVNVYGALYPSKIALPHLKKNKGSLIFISSLAGLKGIPDLSVYSSAKMALTAISQSIRIENAAAGLHVGIMYVGFTQNEPGKTTIGADGQDQLLEKRSEKFAQSPQQVGKAVVKMIERRRSRQTLSFAGKIYAFIIQFFPRILERINILVQKRMENYYK